MTWMTRKQESISSYVLHPRIVRQLIDEKCSSVIPPQGVIRQYLKKPHVNSLIVSVVVYHDGHLWLMSYKHKDKKVKLYVGFQKSHIHKLSGFVTYRLYDKLRSCLTGFQIQFKSNLVAMDNIKDGDVLGKITIY